MKKPPTFDKGFTKALEEAVEQLDGHPREEGATARLGSATLDDGREVEIRVLVTTDPSIFG